MCGILAGWISTKQIVSGIKKLQQRGSDSWGVASFFGKEIVAARSLDKNIFERDLEHLDFGDGPILCHSRWASSGSVCIENTHPIQSAQNNVLLVHNGTLTNFEEVKEYQEKLLNKSYEGKTDTEVLADYIESKLIQYPIVFLQDSINVYFGGTYAIAFLCKNYLNLYWMTNDSPLYYYEGQLSSDPTIWPEYFPLPNNSWGWISPPTKDGIKGLTEYKLYINGKLILLPEYKKNKSFGQTSEICDDYMLKEIGEQCTLSYDYNNEIKGDNPIEIVGCGSSYHAALLGQKYFESNPPRYVSVQYSTEYKNIWSGPKIAISQSGETSDTIEILKQWKESNKHRILITNRPESTGKNLLANDRKLFLMNCGPENAVAATKSFTSTAMMLLQLAQPTLYADLDLNKFRANLAKVLNNDDNIRTLVPKINDFANFMIFGSGLNYPIAREVALKFQECALINCQGMPAEQFKHGSVALADPNFLAVIFFPLQKDIKFERVLNCAKQVKARHGYVLGIGPENCNECDWFIQTPQDNALLQPLINNMVGQLLAYSIGKYRNLDVDNCRSCAKAITVH